MVPILEYGMQKNTVSHFEIYAGDPKKLADFYTKMFDWKVTEMPQSDYILVHSGDTDDEGMLKQPGAINGGIARRPEGFTINGAVNYSMVDSIEDSIQRAASLGATMTKGKNGSARHGMVRDVHGPRGQ